MQFSVKDCDEYSQSLFSKRLIFSLIFFILQSALIKKAEDTEADTAEQSAIKLRAQQQSSNALVLTDQRPVNGTPSSSQLTLVKVPNSSSYPVCFLSLFFKFSEHHCCILFNA